uniref:Uncharacterized protein n=1 Tax=Timema tahoe TaxID=61484 RepID=A0A7R9NZW5_9NEOP|nr:unnamed protein product [Timema tahoe]
MKDLIYDVSRAELVGMVKIGSHQENLNHNHQSHDSTHCTGRTSNIDTLEYNKRSSVSANRSLPEIPVSLEGARLEPGNPLWETEVNGDTSSELYATVQENKHLLVQPQVLVMPTTSTSATIGLKSMAGDQSQTEDTHLNPEHPYDQLHPMCEESGGGAGLPLSYSQPGNLYKDLAVTLGPP